MDASTEYVARLPSPPFQLKADGQIQVTDRYPYQKLSSSQHFRVLELFPRRRKLPFELKFKAPGYKYLLGSLSTHDLADAPSYECLSYVWGTAHSNRVLWLGDQVISISKSLDSALGCLRHETESRFLWVDFVCIDQQNLEERKQQVQLMYRIFSQANGVIAYLGEESDGSHNVPAFLRQIQAAHFSMESDTEELWSEQDLEASRLPPHHDQSWTMLQKFVSRPWFVRVWILQEALAARKLDFLCGGWSEPAPPVIQTLLVAFMHKFTCFGKRSSHSESARNGLEQLSFMVRLGLCSLLELPRLECGLLDILEIARLSTSTDPRDKVYALLNLCSDSISALIQPDYSTDTSELYKQVACAAVIAGHGPRLLLNAGVPYQDSDLPSWVPDWSQSRMPSRNIVGQSFMFPEDDPRSTDSVSYNIKIGQQENELIVPTVMVDSIHHTEPLCVRSIDPDSQIDLLCPFRALLPSDEKVESDIDISTWPELYQRLIVAITNIRDSPQYSCSIQQAVELAWKTLLCSHDLAPGGGYSKTYTYYIHAYILYTRFFFDPWSRVEYIREVMPHLIKNGNAPPIAGLDDEGSISIETLEAAWPSCRECLMTTLRAALSKIIIAPGQSLSKLRLPLTSNAFVGMIPAAAQNGDILACIESVQAPVVLRPVDARRYKFIGCAYFHGFMPGEPKLKALMEETQFQEVILV